MPSPSMVERFMLEPTRLDRPIFQDLVVKSLQELREDYGKSFTRGGKPKPLAAWWYVRQ